MQQVGAIRQREAHYIRQGARIRAFNMGLSFAITPLVRGCCCCWRLPCGCKPMLASGRSSPPFDACSCGRLFLAHSWIPPLLHCPLQSALAAFGVARATDTDNLTVANVFSSLALLVRRPGDTTGLLV